jgi:hypothetical protein
MERGGVAYIKFKYLQNKFYKKTKLLPLFIRDRWEGRKTMGEYLV